MKLNLIAALLLCASVATAASETTTTTTTAAPATEPAAKAVKKAKKKAAAKDEKKDSATVAPATQAPPAAAIAPAAATSTAAAPAVQAPAKKWGVTLLNEIDASYDQGKNLSDKGVTTINYVAASYKITATEKVGLRQYYTYDYDPKSEKSFESSDINQSFTVATIGTKMKGILGSDDISPMFWYYMPGHTAEETNFGKDMDNFAGILRMDAEINYTLNPKWSASYYLNPRQTLGATDKEVNFEATSRLIHYANLYYNVSDATQVYANAGFDHKMATANLTSTSDYYLSAVGFSTSFFGGKLTLNPEVNVTTALKTKGAATKSQELYKKENIAYAFVTVIAL
ncbi:MAG: hypothetical protein V4654_11230 [Bdellovibrionota bacterium]